MMRHTRPAGEPDGVLACLWEAFRIEMGAEECGETARSEGEGERRGQESEQLSHVRCGEQGQEPGAISEQEIENPRAKLDMYMRQKWVMEWSCEVLWQASVRGCQLHEKQGHDMVLFYCASVLRFWLLYGRSRLERDDVVKIYETMMACVKYMYVRRCYRYGEEDPTQRTYVRETCVHVLGCAGAYTEMQEPLLNSMRELLDGIASMDGIVLMGVDVLGCMAEEMHDFLLPFEKGAGSGKV